MEKPIRILLCDDSAVMRRLVKSALEADSNMKVVAEAKHGQDANEKIADAKPDIVIMDVEMPVMDGIDAVRTIRKRNIRIPVIMFSSLTSRGAEATLDAIAAGANDFATKPAGVGHFDQALKHVRADLLPKVRQWAGARAETRPGIRSTRAAAKPATAQTKPIVAQLPKTSATLATASAKVSAVAIGVSTGGPQTLATLISDLPKQLSVPILIAQHMPPVFTGLLAERLSAEKGHVVREATDGDLVQPGEIFIAPGDYHMCVARDKTNIRIRLNQDPPENSCRPSVDPLFRSIANCFGHRSLGIVLTGMGTDGANGSKAMKDKGARIYVQDEETSVIWGMPGNVARLGLADRVLPLKQIASELLRAAPPAAVSAV